MVVGSLSRRIRFAAVVLVLLLLAAMLFSACYVAVEAGHDCHDENCAVCACIALCKTILQQLQGSLLLLALPVPPVFFALVSAFVFAATCVRSTPVSQKVRLNP